VAAGFASCGADMRTVVGALRMGSEETGASGNDIVAFAIAAVRSADAVDARGLRGVVVVAAMVV
jgi:hypothetical protein